MERVREGRVALVTAGSAGLGRAVSRRLAEMGFALAITYRSDRERAESLVREIAGGGGAGAEGDAAGGAGVEVALFQADVALPDQVDLLLDGVEARWGRLDALIHAVGPFLFERRTLAETGPAEWRRLLDGNLSSAYSLLHRALPLMRRGGWGRVVTFGFAGVAEGPAWPGRGAYAAAKAGLASLTRTVAAEEARHGITVNMVCPGRIDPPYKEWGIAEARAASAAGREGLDRAGRRTWAPVGRLGSGEDVARLVGFLCEENSDFLTGNVIQVTGGIDVLPNLTIHEPGLPGEGGE